MTFSEKVLEWATDRDILTHGNVIAQLGKTLEEIGELLSAISVNDIDAITDARGDIDVTLEIVNEMLAQQTGVSRAACQVAAWNEIKDRKGKMFNGFFIKNGDDQ